VRIISERLGKLHSKLLSCRVNRDIASATLNFRDGNETTAYYTDNLEDAVNTAVEMARKRALRAAPDDDLMHSGHLESR
jgi:hypothetical protein